MSSSAALPRAWVDRLFEEFGAIYGAQKLATMWSGSSLEVTKNRWAASLGIFEGATIKMAIESLIVSGNGWPPELPVFYETCRKAALSLKAQVPADKALPAPGGTYTTREEAAEILAKIGYSAPAKPRVDPKAWAHRVLARAAAGDETLALESIRMAERAIKAKDAA